MNQLHVLHYYLWPEFEAVKLRTTMRLAMISRDKEPIEALDTWWILPIGNENSRLENQISRCTNTNT